MTGGGYLLSHFRSTIGVVRLNFSVRNGKRWSPHAITTLISSRNARSMSQSSLLSLFRPSRHSFSCVLSFFSAGWLPESFRVISIARLNASPRLHLRPIDVLVLNDPQGDLILGRASCLDAFSTYPDQTRLPGSAPGDTTGSPEVCPTRSSRTSVGSPQISNAHNR